MTTIPKVRTKAVKTVETFFDTSWATGGITLAFALTRKYHGLTPVEEVAAVTFCVSTLVGVVRYVKSLWRERTFWKEQRRG